jgi:hypothetical protein
LRPRHTQEDNFKVDFKDTACGLYSYGSWLCIGDRSLWTRSSSAFRFLRIQTVFWVGGLYPMEFVGLSTYKPNIGV